MAQQDRDGPGQQAVTTCLTIATHHSDYTLLQAWETGSTRSVTRCSKLPDEEASVGFGSVAGRGWYIWSRFERVSNTNAFCQRINLFIVVRHWTMFRQAAHGECSLVQKVANAAIPT